LSVEQQAARILAAIHASQPSDVRGPAERLVEACRAEVEAAGVSLTWCAENAAPLTIAATPGVGSDLEKLSFIAGESPQADCARTGRIVSRPHLDDGSTRWPVFAPEATFSGIRALFAFPLKLGAISLGVLTIYRDRAGVLSDDHIGRALAYVAAATALLLDQPSNPDPSALPAVLEDPFALQAEVHQATGMIAASLDVDLGTALTVLRAHAYSNSRPIAAVARDVVTRKLVIS
jgi:hypothetical protein